MRTRTSTIEEFDATAPPELRVCGDMAVQVGEVRLRVRDAKDSVVEYRYRSTLVYERRGGRWLEPVDHTTAIR
jgi:ketosteroid isomerase-like protein